MPITAPAVKLRTMQCAFINGSIYCIRNGRKTYGHSRGWRRQRLREMRYRFDAVQLQPRRTQWAIVEEGPVRVAKSEEGSVVNPRESERCRNTAAAAKHAVSVCFVIELNAVFGRSFYM